LILILILVAFWAIVVLPRRRHQRAHTAMQDSVGVGDEIITAGGLHGYVRALDEGTVRVEVAPEVVVTLDRRAIAAVAHDVEVPVGEEGANDPGPGDGPGDEAG
jgi:preprotein translocase subunit YajC